MDARLRESIDPDGVHVWRIELDRPGSGDPTGGEAGVLAPDELERARRFKHARDSDRFVACHVAIREILARYTGIAPGELTFSRSPAGKPALAGPAPGLGFSLSHSGSRALLAVGGDRDLGVDLERVRDDAKILAVAERFFHPDEFARLAAIPDPGARTTACLAHWTRKEAYVKAIGAGLTEPIDAFRVVPAGGRRHRVELADGTAVDHWVHDLEAGPLYVAALAVERPAPRIELRDHAPSGAGAPPLRRSRAPR